MLNKLLIKVHKFLDAHMEKIELIIVGFFLAILVGCMIIGAHDYG